MPGIDFDAVRSSITIAQVLELVGFIPLARTGEQIRETCPLHKSTSPHGKSFSVNLATNRFQCFKCKAAGGQLELWAALNGITVFQAAIDLCDRLSVEVPWLRQWQNGRRSKAIRSRPE